MNMPLNMTLQTAKMACDLPPITRVSMSVFWTTVQSIVITMIAVEFIELYCDIHGIYTA